MSDLAERLEAEARAILIENGDPFTERDVEDLAHELYQDERDARDQDRELMCEP